MDFSAHQKLAALIRYYILAMTTAAGSGHATSSLSSVELATMLYFKYLRFDLDHPDNPANDRVIFSKGHASPLFYALYAAAGKLTEKELLAYRTIGSVLEGHPTPRFPFTEAATGSLGQGLSVGVGEALALRLGSGEQAEPSTLNPLPHVYVLLGDGELAEGSVWEAAQAAGFHKLNNLIAIVDVNRLGQSQETMNEYHAEIYQRRFDTCGWSTIVLDGHNLNEIDGVYQKALDHRRGPIAVIAKTVKGKGVSFLEDKNGWHGKALTKEEFEKAIKELGDIDKGIMGKVMKPEKHDMKDMQDMPDIDTRQSRHAPLASTLYNKPTATRKAFGNALVRLGNDPRLIVFDGDMQNSTYTELFAKKFPERFIQSYIAEQNMVGMALGFASRGYLPVVSTFASFLTRAHDQIRMASISGATILVNGSHAGVSIGADGPSQMGLDDIALFRGIVGSTVLSPSDPYQTERLVELMVGQKGIVYIRTARPETPVIYSEKDTFSIGGSTMHPSVIPAKNDKPVTIIATGVTVHESLKAQKELAEKGVGVTVIDCYSIKPIDATTIQKAAMESERIIIVEDHYPEGGLGEAVRSVLPEKSCKIIHLAVKKLPRSGTPEELLDYEQISAKHIVSACLIP